MKNRITRLFSIFIVISLLISSNIPVFANDETTNNTSNNVEIINADISQYLKFDEYFTLGGTQIRQ